VIEKSTRGSRFLLHFALFLSLASLFVIIACSQQSAKAQIEKRGIPYSQDSYLFQVSRGDKDIVALFLKAGMDVNASDQHGHTALMIASYMGHTNLAKFLLEKGANINARSNEGDTALMEAIYSGHNDTVQLLIEKGADVNARSNGGLSPLMLAGAVGNPEVADALRKAGARQ